MYFGFASAVCPRAVITIIATPDERILQLLKFSHNPYHDLSCQVFDQPPNCPIRPKQQTIINGGKYAHVHLAVPVTDWARQEWRIVCLLKLPSSANPASSGGWQTRLGRCRRARVPCARPLRSRCTRCHGDESPCVSCWLTLLPDTDSKASVQTFQLRFAFFCV